MSIPETDRIKPRPVRARYLRRQAGLPVGPPTEAEKQDAIAVLRDFPTWEKLDEMLLEVGRGMGLTVTGPALSDLDTLVDEAELIHHEASL